MAYYKLYNQEGTLTGYVLWWDWSWDNVVIFYHPFWIGRQDVWSPGLLIRSAFQFWFTNLEVPICMIQWLKLSGVGRGNDKATYLRQELGSCKVASMYNLKGIVICKYRHCWCCIYIYTGLHAHWSFGFLDFKINSISLSIRALLVFSLCWFFTFRMGKCGSPQRK